MHGTFILNVAHLIREPNFASTQSRPSGWNCINHTYYMGCRQVAKHQWWNNPSLKYFQLIPEASPVSDGIAITLSVESHANCSTLPNPNPTFPCSSGFCLLGGHSGGDPLNPQVGSLPLNNSFPIYHSTSLIMEMLCRKVC